MTAQTTKKKVMVDMDGVLCDFAGAFNKEHSDKVKFPQSRWGFFTNLEPIPSSIYIVKELMKDFDVWILTRPSYMNPLCYTEKRIWIEKYFGLEFCQKLIICSDKSLVKGDFLVDDSITDGQLEFEGELIRFGSSDFEDWFDVHEYLMTKNEKIKNKPLLPEAIISYIENDAEICIPIDRFFNEDGNTITKKEYGKILLEKLCIELREHFC